MDEFIEYFEENVAKIRSLKEQAEQVTSMSHIFHQNANSPSNHLLANSIVFASSRSDKAAVDIVCRHLGDFSQISIAYGFNLHIQYEDANGVVVRLLQSSDTFDSRKAFQEMDVLLKKIRDKDEELKTSIQKSIDNLQQESMAKIQSCLEENEKMKEQIAALTSKVPQQPSSPKKIAANRMPVPNLNLIKQDDETLEYLCMRLCGPTKRGCERPLLEGIRNMEERKKVVIHYLDHIQTGNGRGLKKDIILNISNHLYQNREYFCWPLSQEEIKSEVARIEERFGLTDVVGTIHTLLYVFEEKPYRMDLAIVDKKIVHWEYNNMFAEDNCRKKQSQFSILLNKYKFVTRFPVDGNNMFVQSNNKDIFHENEKVITWLRNNFECLECGLPFQYDDAVMPSIYNIMLESTLKNYY